MKGRIPFGVYSLLSLACGLAVLAGVPAPVPAAPQTSAEIAAYRGADRQAVLEAGARKEGSVLVYGTGTQMEPVRNAFRQKYPFIRLEVFSDGAPQVTRKLLEEYKASRFTVDVLSLSTGGLHILREAGLLQPYTSPELDRIRKEAIQPDGLWALTYENYVGLGYNTKEIKGSDVPRTYDDLLDPKWKGKMAIADSGSTFENWIGGVVLTKGEAFLRSLKAQNFPVFKIGGRGFSNLVVSGEQPISPAIYSSHMANSKSAGASVAWRALGPSYALIDAVALPAKPAHPHGAMLYIDFVLSIQAQKMVQEMGYASARTDLENAEKPERILYLTERPNYAAEYEHWSKLKVEVFGKATPLAEPK